MPRETATLLIVAIGVVMFGEMWFEEGGGDDYFFLSKMWGMEDNTRLEGREVTDHSYGPLSSPGSSLPAPEKCCDAI
eukprot:1321018-Amorphochlora_amoeboformis.AAC.1